MRILELQRVEHDDGHVYRWPSGNEEAYPDWVEYLGTAEDRRHVVRIGFGRREVYGRDRVRVVVWVDGYPRAEFFEADDFATTGDVLCVLKVGKRECRYPDETPPERYAMFDIVGLPTRVEAKGVHSAWAVAANIADHRAMAALGGLRMKEIEG